MRKTIHRNVRRSKGAVSEVIATVLMVLLVVSICATVLAYASNGLQSFGGSFSNLLANQGDAASQQLDMEQATFNLTGSSALPYLVLTFTNSQTSPTPTPFQQQVIINPSLYSSHEANDLGNLRFFSTLVGSTFSGPIDSWLENVTSLPANSATFASFWISLSSGIPASSSINVYLAFEPVTTEFDGSIAGEAPQLSATYGQYDNGAQVFTQYGGASWSSFTFQSGAWSASNGYLQQTGTAAAGGTNGGPAALIESTQYSVTGSYLIEMAFSYTSQATARIGIIADATPTGAVGSGDTMGYRFIGQQTSNGPGFVSFLNDLTAWVANGAYQGVTGTSYSLQIQDAAGTWSGSLYSGYSVNGNLLASLASTTYTTANNQGATSGYIGISAAYYTGSQVVANPINVQWFRLRALPPNGIMPTQATASLFVPSQAGVTLYIRNTGPAPTTISVVYVQNLTSNTFVFAYAVSPGVIINPQTFQTIAVVFVPTVGATYEFTAVTRHGTQVVGTFVE